MSAQIVNVFTSNENIKYLRDYFTKNLQDSTIKDQILDTLIETVFHFYDHELLENNTYRLRRSVNLWDEVRKLNKSFIDDRLALINSYDSIGTESYHMQMLIDDSIAPNGYESLNKPCKDDIANKRIFRYQDPYDINRSEIPIQQILSRSFVDTNVPELWDSDINHDRSTVKQLKMDYICNIPSSCNRPQWFDA